MAITLDEIQKNELLNNFIENVDFYKNSDFKEVQKIIASNYFNNYEVIERISKTEKSRNLLSSSGLLLKILSEINGARYKFENEVITEELFTIITLLQIHEDKFYTQNVISVCSEFLSFLISNIEKNIVAKNLSDSNKENINTLYFFFKRIVNVMNVMEADKPHYFNLFNNIKTLFQVSNFKNASIWFRFYFEFPAKGKNSNAIKSEIHNVTVAYLRSSLDAKELKNNISEIHSIKDFTSKSPSYLNEIYNRCISNVKYTIEFYSYFEDIKKQTLLETWIPVNANKSVDYIKEILLGIEYDIPDKVKLANKILVSANNTVEREQLYDLLFTLKLTNEEYDSSSYSNQIITLIFNTDIRLHNVGMKELNKNKKRINSINFKSRASAFINTCFSNLNPYHIFLINVLDSKMGIESKVVDDIVKSQPSYSTNIINFLINTGNIKFYNVIKSKLKDATVVGIEESFINSISYHEKYKDIIGALDNKENRRKLNSTTLTKLDSLIVKML